MFHLIVAVSAISTVMALTLASVFYFGEALQKEKERAAANAGKPAAIQSEAPAALPSAGSVRWDITDSF